MEVAERAVGADAAVYVTAWQRWRHWLRGLFEGERRPATAAERVLAERLAGALKDAAEADALRADTERILNAKVAELTVAGLMIENLTLVCARDRQRVQMEMAEFARRQAEAEGRKVA